LSGACFPVRPFSRCIFTSQTQRPQTLRFSSTTTLFREPGCGVRHIAKLCDRKVIRLAIQGSIPCIRIDLYPEFFTPSPLSPDASFVLPRPLSPCSSYHPRSFFTFAFWLLSLPIDASQGLAKRTHSPRNNEPLRRNRMWCTAHAKLCAWLSKDYLTGSRFDSLHPNPYGSKTFFAPLPTFPPKHRPSSFPLFLLSTFILMLLHFCFSQYLSIPRPGRSWAKELTVQRNTESL
jgi:hypothetical protein